MNQIGVPMPPAAMPSGYDHDFSQWLERQTELLHAKDFERLDLSNLVEEIEGMGKSIQHELASRLEVLIVHLLKCEFQPDHKSSSWTGSIGEQRSQIMRTLKQSPSLKPLVIEYANDSYCSAVIRAANDTGLPEHTFPPRFHYSQDQLLDLRYIP